MAKIVFVDTTGERRLQACYGPSEDKFFEVGDLIGRCDEVYINRTLSPNMWPQLETVVSGGVKIFCSA